MNHINHRTEIVTIALVLFVIFGVLVFNNPSLTGFVTRGNETLLGINETNESGNVQNITQEIVIGEPPVQIKDFEDVITNETTVIALSEYFEDPDSDSLYFDIRKPEELNATIYADQLIIEPEPKGEYNILIYASDGDNTITSNEFLINTTQPMVLEGINVTNETNTSTGLNDTINITAYSSNTTDINATVNETIENETNTTTNGTINETNAAVNETATGTINTTTEPEQETPVDTTQNTTQTNTTQNNTVSTTNTSSVNESQISCSNPDPNLRPINCIEEDVNEYYDFENIFLTNNNRIPVARINPVGNIIITGQVIEHSTAEPSTDDFRITRLNRFLEEETVAFIDTNTGNFHIRGKLVEEDFFLKPTSGAYIIQNKRNVNLAYVDINTGDLHIKNNIIQNKEEIQ